jgi:hypothetical protein
VTQNWKDLADAVRTRRDHLGLRQKDMARHGGPSYETMRVIEKGEPPSSGAYQSRTITGLEKALQWKPGTVQALLDGRAGDDPNMWVDSTPSIRPRNDVTARVITAHATGEAHDLVRCASPDRVSAVVDSGQVFINNVERHYGVEHKAAAAAIEAVRRLQREVLSEALGDEPERA